jgi:hypothetical protein
MWINLKNAAPGQQQDSVQEMQFNSGQEKWRI